MPGERPVGLVARDVRLREVLQQLPARIGPTRLRYGRRMADASSDRRGESDQAFEQDGDGLPVGHARTGAVSMRRLNRRLELESPDATRLRSFSQE